MAIAQQWKVAWKGEEAGEEHQETDCLGNLKK